jgi:hypothetical protein
MLLVSGEMKAVGLAEELVEELTGARFAFGMNNNS